MVLPLQQNLLKQMSIQIADLQSLLMSWTAFFSGSATQHSTPKTETPRQTVRFRKFVAFSRDFENVSRNQLKTVTTCEAGLASQYRVHTRLKHFILLSFFLLHGVP
jgi:hypothetical protein